MKTKIMVFIFISFACCIFAQTFIQADFDRLVKNHPLMKNYDEKTGFFKNTDYDIKDISALKAENASLISEYEKIIAEKKLLSEKIIEDDSEEEKIWSFITELDNKKKEIENQVEKNDLAIEALGYPSSESLVKIIDRLTEESLIPLYSKEKIFLNKLPRYALKPPKIKDSDLRRFYYSVDSNILKEYLNNSYAISQLFDSADKTILYIDENSQSNSFAQIDLSIVLALHPKMSLFDFKRFGFYKLPLGLSESAFNDEIKKQSKDALFNDHELASANAELSELKIKLKRLEIQSRVGIEDKNTEKEKFKAEYEKEIKNLTFKRDRLKFELANNDLTKIDETKRLLAEIEQEVLSIVADYAKAKNIEVMLNTSVPSLNQDAKYVANHTRSLFLTSDRRLYYSFLANKNFADKSYENAISIGLILWLELTKNPLISNIINIENFPLVVIGGDNATESLVKKIYYKYRVGTGLIDKISLFLQEKEINDKNQKGK